MDPLILTRGVHIAATIVASGTVAFMVLVAEPPWLHARLPAGFAALRVRLTLLVWIALGVAIISGAVWLVQLAAEIFGASLVDVCLHGGAWQVASDTRFGLVWLLRVLLAVALGMMMLMPAAKWPQLATAALLIALIAPTGHAGATPGMAGNIHIAADMVHLVAAGCWLGALPALVMLLIQARSAKAWRAYTQASVKRFSQLGMLCVAALLASGIINAWNLLSGPRDLIATEYGRLMLLKVGLFTAMVAIATVNKFHLTPRLPAGGPLRVLQRNSVGEIVLGLAVMVLVGWLGTLAPSTHVHTNSAEIPDGAAFVHIHGTEAMADVTIDPGQSGTATATIRVMREDSSVFEARVVALALDPPGAASTSEARTASRMADGTWQVGDIALQPSGIWTVRVIVAPPRGETIVLDAPIVIE
ncbi:MAG: copper homeostasis membrane protein CopD [Pseudolabrys sp.]